MRIGQVLTLSDPVIWAYDQDAWVSRSGAVDGFGGDVRSWIALHSGLRRRLRALLSTLSPAEWARGGRHEERGVETVRSIVEHDREHLAQLRAGVV